MSIVWLIVLSLVGGLVIGALGAALASRGRGPLPYLLCGVGGMLIGSLVYYALFGVADGVRGDLDHGWADTSRGVDWWRHLWQVGTAAGLVWLASATAGPAQEAGED